MEFQKLTPIDDAEIGVYEDALDYVFKNDDVLNVAISGPYSAGKSSLIETYKKSHEGKEGGLLHDPHVRLSFFGVR